MSFLRTDALCLCTVQKLTWLHSHDLIYWNTLDVPFSHNTLHSYFPNPETLIGACFIICCREPSIYRIALQPLSFTSVGVFKMKILLKVSLWLTFSECQLKEQESQPAQSLAFEASGQVGLTTIYFGHAWASWLIHGTILGFVLEYTVDA